MSNNFAENILVNTKVCHLQFDEIYVGEVNSIAYDMSEY